MPRLMNMCDIISGIFWGLCEAQLANSYLLMLLTHGILCELYTLNFLL